MAIFKETQLAFKTFSDAEGPDKNNETSNLEGRDENDDNSDYQDEGSSGNKIIKILNFFKWV